MCIRDRARSSRASISSARREVACWWVTSTDVGTAPSFVDSLKMWEPEAGGEKDQWIRCAYRFVPSSNSPVSTWLVSTALDAMTFRERVLTAGSAASPNTSDTASPIAI
eukprot:TRINITY_DN8787_c0_g1_i2.p1 TRINITY_DN8787_c0_g1~~TRINITY_DN8787_c0_g1_i2.p1  ORF type:complete len:109 (+),score=5.12 TRINITY_DN8787_c0_g1_i2:61-387(+)